MITETENVLGDSLYYFCAIVTFILALGATPCSATATVPASSALSSGNLYLVYRVHQIDILDKNLGSRSSTINLEAFTPTHLSDSFIRKCALFKFTDIISDGNALFIDKVLGQTLVSGALIIFNNMSIDLTREELNNLHKIESRLLSTGINLPIYMINENDYINQLYLEYNKQDQDTKKLTIYELFYKNVFFDSHQFVINGPSSKSIDEPIVTSFEAKLIGSGIESQLPNYAIVAHYDSYSIVPNLSFGADSNGSGLVILLELMRLFAKLYSNNKTRPKANIYFLVSGGAKENYFGTEKWVNYYSQQDIESPLKKMSFVMCLDSLADSLGQSQFYMHVARLPRAGSPANQFFETFNSIIKSQYPLMNLTQVHQRLNLPEQIFSWEHERFSARRLSAFTLSNLPSPNSPIRRSLVDVYHEKYINNLEQNANIIAETFVRVLFPDVKENILGNSEFRISRTYLKSMFKYFTKFPRHQQLLLTTHKKSQNSYQMPNLLLSIKTTMTKFSNHLREHHFTVSKTNPEFTFYNPVQSEMSIYNMKPAAFDLMITIAILSYLCVFYLIVKNFETFNRMGKILHVDSIVSRFDSFKSKTR